MEDGDGVTKKQYTKPVLTVHGSIEKLTGYNDGQRVIDLLFGRSRGGGWTPFGGSPYAGS